MEKEDPIREGKNRQKLQSIGRNSIGRFKFNLLLFTFQTFEANFSGFIIGAFFCFVLNTPEIEPALSSMQKPPDYSVCGFASHLSHHVLPDRKPFSATASWYGLALGD